jgi:hypothetical protein
MRAIAQDMTQLAQHRGCDHLLIASDDDRLVAPVDSAQQRGVLVHLLIDERLRDPRQLREDDTGWASLLAQGDRRVMVTGSMLAELAGAERAGGMGAGGPAGQGSHGSGYGTTHGTGYGTGYGASHGPARGAAAEAAVDRALVETVVAAWWKEQDMPQRDLLHDALPRLRGLPQDADRELLMRLGQQLGRQLSVPEKKVMRETARAAIAATGDSADQPNEVDEVDEPNGRNDGEADRGDTR